VKLIFFLAGLSSFECLSKIGNGREVKKRGGNGNGDEVRKEGQREERKKEKARTRGKVFCHKKRVGVERDARKEEDE
jgi:hypothetical protein